MGEDSTKAVPRIGCLGVGWIGRHRMKCVTDEGVGEIVAIADPHEDAITEALASVPQAKVVRDFDALLSLELDGIMIATPSAMHAEQSLLALRSGAAVFCQKPLGRTASETARVVEVAREVDRLLAVDLSYRHVAGVAQMRELVQSGELGRVFAIELTFHNAYGPDKPWFYDPAQSGGGCLMDLGVHCLDLALWAMDRDDLVVEDARCFARGEVLRDRGTVEDYATARLRLGDDATMALTCSWNLNAGQDAVIEAEFYGTEGAATLRNVGGSFYDFDVEHHVGTGTSTIARPPDAWGGRAAVAWARALARSRRFDPAAEEYVVVARALDDIYRVALR